ncbi:MAG: amidohydrolase family protein [Thermoplasmata archaeon]
MSLLVTDGTLLTQDDERRVVKGNLLTEKDRIRAVGGAEGSADRTLDATGCLVIPGLVNGYTRAAHVLLGPPQDQPWGDMAEAMASLQSNLTKRDLEVAAALAVTEMLASGTTCFLDLFVWEEEVGRAVSQAGIRAHLAWAVTADEDLPLARRFLHKMQGRDRIQALVGATELSQPQQIKALAVLAREEGTRWCLPLSERRSDVYGFQRATGRRPVEWLEREGFLSPEFLAFHGVWLTLNEIRALARNQVPVIHCPGSNQMTGAGGPMPLPEMLREGVVVGLGTDSPFLSGSLSLRAAMGTCGHIHRGTRGDPTVLPAQTLLDLGTRGGAQAFGLRTGHLQRGAPADFVVLETGMTSSDPVEESLSLLAYGGRALRVRDVVVAGKLVVEGGRVMAFDLADLQARVGEVRRELGLAHSRD